MNTTQEIWPGNTVDLQMVWSVEYAEAVAAGVAADGVQIPERVIVRTMRGEFVLRGATMEDYRRISAMVIEAQGGATDASEEVSA